MVPVSRNMNMITPCRIGWHQLRAGRVKCQDFSALQFRIGTVYSPLWQSDRFSPFVQSDHGHQVHSGREYPIALQDFFRIVIVGIQGILPCRVHGTIENPGAWYAQILRGMPGKSGAGSIHNQIRSFDRNQRLFHKSWVFLFQPEHPSGEIKACPVICDKILHNMIGVSVQLTKLYPLAFRQLPESFGCQNPELMPALDHFFTEFNQRIDVTPGSDSDCCDNHFLLRLFPQSVFLLLTAGFSIDPEQSSNHT